MELTPDELLFKERAEQDTGVFAREVLGFNYDRDWHTQEHINIGTGGIRDNGPHKEMTDFLDRPGRNKMLQLPRDGYKSSGLKAKAMRASLVRPNIRILYGMETTAKAKQKLLDIKRTFSSNKILLKHWGKRVKDDKLSLRGEPWGAEGFTLNTRTLGGLDNPTFSCFGVDKTEVGGHFDLVILDDLVSQKNINAEQIQKVIDAYQWVQPLLDPGAEVIVCGTRYADGDLYGWIMEELGDLFDTFILDCGMVPEKQGEEDRFELVGTPNFAHLTVDYLKEKLRTMKYPKFLSQYCNNPIGAGRQYFSARDFIPVAWDETWMPEMPCYVMTDTAVGQSQENCHSVVGLVGLDHDTRSYLLDLEVGHWEPNIFVKKLLDLVVKWDHKVSIRGICFENIALNDVFYAMIDNETRNRRIRLPVLIRVRRSGGEAKKRARIERLTGRIADRNFLVVGRPPNGYGVPKYYKDMGKKHLLWDPEGAKDTNGASYPDGELVRQFTRFPAYTKNDIADALADIDATDETGYRYCQPMARRRREKKERRRKAGDLVMMRTTVNGSEIRIPAKADHGKSTFWSDVASGIDK